VYVLYCFFIYFELEFKSEATIARAKMQFIKWQDNHPQVLSEIMCTFNVDQNGFVGVKLLPYLKISSTK